jgi:Domain of unknown function (DUF4279)
MQYRPSLEKHFSLRQAATVLTVILEKIVKKEIYLNKAIEEILNPTLEITKQYLEVLEVEIENGMPKVERFEENFDQNTIAIYFKIKEERFFLEIHLNKNTNEIDSVWIQNGHRTYFTATSENLSYSELEKVLGKEQTEGWSKGEFRKNGNSKYTFSRISFEPTKCEAYELNNQLEILLTELEQKKENIIKLSEIANIGISVCKHQYISGNAGISFERKLIEKMNNLNLGIDIDTYIVGNEIK